MLYNIEEEYKSTSAQQSIYYYRIGVKVDTCFGYQVAIIRSNTRIYKIIQSYAYEWDPITFTKDRVVVPVYGNMVIW